MCFWLENKCKNKKKSMDIPLHLHIKNNKHYCPHTLVSLLCNCVSLILVLEKRFINCLM